MIYYKMIVKITKKNDLIYSGEGFFLLDNNCIFGCVTYDCLLGKIMQEKVVLNYIIGDNKVLQIEMDKEEFYLPNTFICQAEDCILRIDINSKIQQKEEKERADIEIYNALVILYKQNIN